MDVNAYINVPRSLLLLVDQGELWLTHAFVLALVHFRAGKKHTVDVAELVELTGFTRQHCSDVLKQLRERGWLDEQRRPARPMPTGKAGFLRIDWAELRALGTVDVALYAQLKSLPTMDVAQLNEDGSRAPTGMLARMLGVCRDAVRASFKRLKSGDTVKSRLAARRGQPLERRSWIAHQTKQGAASRVRMRNERESSSSSTPAPTQQRAPVPSWDELLSMAKAARAGPPG